MTTPPNRAEHELHWVPARQAFEIVALHPMTPEAGCGWVGQVSSDGDSLVVTHWCIFAQQHEWGVEEMIEGARWDGPDGASIPVAAITDFDYDEGPCVTRLGPLNHKGHDMTLRGDMSRHSMFKPST